MKCIGACLERDELNIERECCQQALIRRWPPEDKEQLQEMIRRVLEASKTE